MTELVSERTWRALERAHAESRPLGEPEAYELARALGLAVPFHRLLERGDDLASLDLASFPGDHVVLKAVVPGLLHKTDVGAVVVAPKDVAAIRQIIEGWTTQPRLGGDLTGVLVSELVRHEGVIGGELMLALTWSREFGPLVTLGPGGTDVELLVDHLEGGRSVLVLSSAVADGPGRSLDRKAFLSAICTARRGGSPEVDRRVVERVLGHALDFAERTMPHRLVGLEVNPVVSTPEGLVALDAMAWSGPGEPVPAPDRPLDQIHHLLHPRSVVVVGVSSTRLNPGRAIVRRLQAAGYEGRLAIVKPGIASVDGCPCVSDLDALETPVDLLVLSLSAAQAVDWVDRCVESTLARSVLLVSSGFEEREAGQRLGERVRAGLRRARAAGRPAPIVNGGNCLGIRSRPGRVDTLFVSTDKLPVATARPEPLAIISQSGAFAIARESDLAPLESRYLVTVGNQTDLTIGDYLTYLADDRTVEVFGCYVEGFRPLDGRRFLEAARRIRNRGGAVVLYRGGRTSPGAAAAASHTAALAGSYRLARELAEAAGVLVADSLDEFTDLVRLLCLLNGRLPRGGRLGVMSNAGFECVAAADGVAAAGLELAPLTRTTEGALRTLFTRHDLAEIVSVRNPLDVTPMLDDDGFVSAAGLVLRDDTVDLAIVGCVPFTDAIDTRSPSSRSASIAHRLGQLCADGDNPSVVVVDAAAGFDPVVDVLESHRVPVFRTVDRALRALGHLADWSRHFVSP